MFLLHGWNQINGEGNRQGLQSLEWISSDIYEVLSTMLVRSLQAKWDAFAQEVLIRLQILCYVVLGYIGTQMRVSVCNRNRPIIYFYTYCDFLHVVHEGLIQLFYFISLVE